jgi:hypothetical protein
MAVRRLALRFPAIRKNFRYWYDNITCEFWRLINKLRKADSSVPNITYYQFRKTSASLIKNELKYRMLNELWLGHAPRSVADKHYNADDDTILDECIAWLYCKIFGDLVSLPKGRKR